MDTDRPIDTDNNQSTDRQVYELSVQESTGPRHRFQSIIDEYGLIPPKVSRKQRAKDYVKNQWREFSFIDFLNAFLDKLPIIRCVKDYKLKQYAFGDLIAGITVAVMHIPQGIAYGVLANLSASYGLYVSFFPVLIYMILGTCPHLSVGTFAIISLMTAKAIDGIPLESSVVDDNSTLSFDLNATNSSSSSSELLQRAGIATTLAFFVGLVQLILSFLKLGFITVYLTEPFISGFTTGAAVHVFSSQVPTAFGVSSPRDIQGAFKLPRFYYKVIDSIFGKINWVTTAISASSIVLLYFAKKLNDRYKSKIKVILPFELLLVIVGTLISHLVKLSARHNVKVVGRIQRGLPGPKVPPFTHISDLILPAITIAAVGLCLNIAMAKMFGRKHGYKVSSNQELLAYGLSNSISSFFQCFPNSASLSRSVLQESSGGKTVIAGLVSSIILAIVIAAIAPIFEPLPMACLAAIIMVSLKGLLLQVKEFKVYYRISIFESILWLTTFLVTVLFDVDIGLYVGLAVSFVLNTIRTQKPRFAVLGRVPNTVFYKNTKIFPSAEQHSSIKVLRFDGSLYASNASFFKRKLYESIGIKLQQPPLIKPRNAGKVETNENPIKYIVLDCAPFNFIDTVGVKLLVEIHNDLKKRGIQLFLSECRYDVRRTFNLMDFDSKIGNRIIYASTDDAVNSAKFELENVPTVSSGVTTF